MACSLWHVHQTLLYNPEPSAQGWPCPQWARPSYINQQSKKCPNNIPQTNLLEAINQSRFSFQGTWKFVAKLTKITSTNRWMRPKVKGFCLFVFYFIFSLLHTKFFKVVSTNKRFSQYISFWDAWKRENSLIFSYFTESCYLLLNICYAFSKMLSDI